MTSNQRRPGFRLPWASESEAAEAEAASDQAPETPEVATKPVADSPKADAVAMPSANGTPKAGEPATAATPEAAPVSVTTPAPKTAALPPPASTAQSESSAGFMRDLVAAMRRVAEETRQSGLSELRTTAEEQVRSLEADAERRREDLKARSETDVAAVGEWAEKETERIKQEAEQRIIARRAQLDQQLAAETTRSEAEAKALRDRVAEYERELDAYHAQLSDIADPAAFAAAAKRMPAPPQLRVVDEPSPSASASDPPAADPPAADPPASAADVHPAEEEVLTARLAELDASLETSGAAAATAAPAASAEPTSTEIVVKGLGSFGAITGFRQALAAVDGVEGVSLSLGPTGEFVFRAIHPTGFDVAAAIAKLEGDAAKIEAQDDGGLRVTLDRAR